MRLAVLALALTMHSAAPAADFAGGRLYVASVERGLVFEMNDDGVITREFGMGAPLIDPRGLAFGPSGDVYVTSGDQIVVINAKDKVTSTLSDPQVVAPRGLAFGPNGHLFCTATDRIAEFDEDGALVRTFGGDAGLGVPTGLAFAPDGSLLVTSGGANEVVVFEPGGAAVASFSPADLAIPTGIAFGAGGDVYLASLLNSAVLVLDPELNQVDRIEDGALAFPSGLAFGPDGDLYVSSLLSDSVVVFDGQTHEKVRELTGSGQIGAPEGIAFAPWRFSTKVTGEVQRAGKGPASLKGKAVLSWLPGSRQIAVEFEGKSLTKKLRLSQAVMHGFATDDGGGAPRRRFHGQQYDHGVAADGVLSGYLDAKGKAVDFGPKQAFQPKSGKLRLQRATPTEGWIATLKVLDKLN